MFGWLSFLFKSNKKAMDNENIVLQYKDYSVILPKDVYMDLKSKNICINAVKYKGKPSCIQLNRSINGKTEYMGTLKNFMNVKSFKDKNVCNFDRNNLIYKEGNKNDK